MWVGTSVISPEGNVHPAGFYKHEETCERVVAALGIGGPGCASDRLAARGYLKITADGCIFLTDYGPAERITQAQFDAIFDMVVALNEGRKPDDGKISAEGLLERLDRLEVR